MRIRRYWPIAATSALGLLVVVSLAQQAGFPGWSSLPAAHPSSSLLSPWLALASGLGLILISRRRP